MVNINGGQAFDRIYVFLLAAPVSAVKHGVELRGIIRVHQGDPLNKSILFGCDVYISKLENSIVLFIWVKPVFSSGIWFRIENKLIFPISRFIYKYINTQLPVARRKDTLWSALR